MSKDNGEFIKLYEKYVDKIYRFIYYKTQHKETAEDITSSAFLKALESFGSFDPEKASFQTWLYTIARNSVIDFYRSRKPALNIEDVWGLSKEEDIERDLDTAQKLREVEKYLKKLKPEQREIVVLRVWEELSYKEIAQITGKNEGTCKMSFSRSIKQLREEMPLHLFLFLLSGLPF